jgi:hypothetical protein
MKYEPCPMPWCSPHDMPKILMSWMTNILKYHVCDQTTYSKMMAISMPQCSNWFKNHQLVRSISLMQCFDKFKHHEQVNGKVHSHSTNDNKVQNQKDRSQSHSIVVVYEEYLPITNPNYIHAISATYILPIRHCYNTLVLLS